MSDEVVKSVGRVLEVLELFSDERTPLNATEVERHLNYPQSSTLALLKSLVKLGYLSFDRIDRSYFPTTRVAYLGQWLETSLYSGRELSTMMNDVREATGESVVLSCQNDLLMQFLQVLPGRRPLAVNVQAGETAPLFKSVIGLVALSARTDEDVAKLAARHNRRTPARERVDLVEVRAGIDEIRARGHGVSFETYVHGLGVVAWPLPRDGALMPLILSVAGPAQSIRAEVDDIVRIVRVALRDCLP